ncbi:hypothetical protein Dform_00274 [Dehalogenimonas formicexedens]|uniref:TIGR04255 family protein n=1 Tax=Dehalogenimonas formicexedens TaxID=1839801 RepID=A0A1P8F583_9CHLR|nr:TIGR04255 family protein [Dehalogenimonas formicexedens]APV43634.1 hypothetical protein Dform_00274 [Dehalogenimonas formicexedens]
MAIKEIFPHPTVTQVIFQIRFPNLLFLEGKMGDFQLKIMKQFPESNVVFRRQFAWIDVGPKVQLGEIRDTQEKEGGAGQKIWQFVSPLGLQLNVLTNSLDIVSTQHKTYDLDGEVKFREIIKNVVDNLLEVVSIPIFQRIGLRYIDNCPVLKKTNASFRRYYNSTFPLSRFDISTVTEMDFKVLTKRNNYGLRYVESLQKSNDKDVLVLDFDAFANNIAPNEYLKVTDDLHRFISDEYDQTIKEPVRAFMRKRGAGSSEPG